VNYPRCGLSIDSFDLKTLPSISIVKNNIESIVINLARQNLKSAVIPCECEAAIKNEFVHQHGFSIMREFVFFEKFIKAHAVVV